ncbi:MAG: pentapeptide repeat-containing protein [bacterium]|nr:pentapeptide repeat-containing protein [bacterium]
MFLILMWLERTSPESWGNYIVEAWGLFYDIVLFGVILSLYNAWRERRVQIREYEDQLTDFLFWTGEEGVYRKAGIIRRLNGRWARLPSLKNVYLRDASLRWADFSHTDLRGAEFSGADLRGTDFWHADLAGANLADSDLRGAEFFHANLHRVNFRGASLGGGNDMRQPESKRIETRALDSDKPGLCSTDFTSAEHLTWKQLKQANEWDQAASYPDNVIAEAKADGVILENKKE